MLVGDGVGFFLPFLFTRFGFHWFGILSFIHFIGISYNLVMHKTCIVTNAVAFLRVYSNIMVTRSAFV